MRERIEGKERKEEEEGGGGGAGAMPPPPPPSPEDPGPRLKLPLPLPLLLWPGAPLRVRVRVRLRLRLRLEAVRSALLPPDLRNFFLDPDVDPDVAAAGALLAWTGRSLRGAVTEDRTEAGRERTVGTLPCDPEPGLPGEGRRRGEEGAAGGGGGGGGAGSEAEAEAACAAAAAAAAAAAPPRCQNLLLPCGGEVGGGSWGGA